MEFSILLATAFLGNLNCFIFTETMYTAAATEAAKAVSVIGIGTENFAWRSFSYSPVDLYYLSSFEEDLFDFLKEYVAGLENEPEYFFKRYMADYEGSSLEAFNGWNATSVRSKHFLIHTNPLLSYRMIWRFVTDLSRIRDAFLSSGYSEKFTKLLHATGESHAWPTGRDLNSSMDSLLTLHDVYDLNLTEFVNGIIENVITNSSLSAIHCFEIAQYALMSEKYTLALQWLEIAKEKRLNFNGHPILNFLEDAAVAELLEKIIKEHDAVWEPEHPHSNNLYQYYYKIDSEYTLISQKTVLKREYKGKGDGESLLSYNDITAFSTLCKGGNLQSEKEKSELYCWYESKINPAWYINPQKMELHAKDPYIWQVYDFIGDDLIEYLKGEAIPFLQRSKVSIDKNDPQAEQKKKDNNYSKSRTSMYSWLYEQDYKPRLPTLSKRISYLTGLSTSWGRRIGSEALQIATYATGGYFNVHVDPLDPADNFDEKIIGGRLATFMLYLCDVELGGKTAFTSAGVAVPPVRGSAVFWYDYKHNGETDYKTCHGGCPVLLGEKWVGTKWIYNNLNIFHRKCTLNKEE